MTDVTEKLEIVGRNEDGSYTVRRQESTALAPRGGYPVRINGTVVNFASEEDFRNAQLAISGGGGIPEVNTRRAAGAGSGGGAGFLRTATDTAETVNEAVVVRNLQNRRRDYQDLAVSIADARQKVAAQSATEPLVPALLELFDAFGDAVSLTISNLEDDINSGYVRTGIGAARTASDFIGRGNSGGSDEGLGSALLAGGIGLGGGLLLAQALGRGPRRRRI